MMMNGHPIKFEFVDAKDLMIVNTDHILVVADEKKTEVSEFLLDLIQKIFPEYRFPATNWGAFTDYLCELDQESRPNTVIAHLSLPRFDDLQQINYYIKSLGQSLLRWRIDNSKTERLVIRFLKQDESYIVNVMNEDWALILSSPFFDPNRYEIKA